LLYWRASIRVNGLRSGRAPAPSANDGTFGSPAAGLIGTDGYR
jgi:hypothetical protein